MRWIGFLGVLISAPLFLVVTIGAHIPPTVVPIVLFGLFWSSWLILRRLTREPSPKPDAAPDVGGAQP